MLIGTKIKFSNNCKAIVKYIGEIDGEVGQWVGLELDQPIGKHDGSIKGKKYFESKNLHGIFVKKEKIKSCAGLTQSSSKDTNKDTNKETIKDTTKEENFSVENTVKITLYKSKIQNLKKEKEVLKCENDLLKKENDLLKKDLSYKDKFIEKFKTTSLNLLNKISDFEYEAKKIIEDITEKVNRIKKYKSNDFEEDEYYRLCTLFKNIILSSVDNNIVEIENNLKEYQKILKRNNI